MNTNTVSPDTQIKNENRDEESKQIQTEVSNDNIDNPNNEEIINDPDILDTDEDLTLQYRWALWYSAPKSKDKEKKWDTERVKKVVEVGNVKEFWRVFNNLAPPSTLKDGSDLQLFRAGVSPAWEDSLMQKAARGRIGLARTMTIINWTL